MTEIINLIELDPILFAYLAIDLIIAILLLGSMRFISGFFGRIETTEELANRDNFAFGISIAGSLAALGIVLSGAVSGGFANSMLNEAIGMTLYGVVGISLVLIGRILHDKLSLNHINKIALIQQHNISVALVDAAAVIATAIIVRAVLIWVEGIDINTVIAILSGFVLSQLLLIIITRIREKQYSNANQGEPFQKALARGQTAIAIRHMGYLIGTSIAVSTASKILIYDQASIVNNLVGWFSIAVILTLILHLLMQLGKTIILVGINLTKEVDHQENIGVACIEMVIAISIAQIINGAIS